ncbi:gas vesicle protein GvpO [Dactylosporangium sp. NPDC005555]|uniref:gas vesicle protein GvpO n=1 Tax=Dactylosporangium sp. NPDC005555 TaxID=3154889 RepID=UPI0033A2D8D2
MPGGRNAADRRTDASYEDYDEAAYDEQGDEKAERRPRARTPAGPLGDEQRRPEALSPVTVTRAVLRDVAELTGKQPSGITALERDNGGWVVEVEVVEDRRIPSSGDILSIYRAQATAAGSLTAFRRIRRYQRGRGND